MWHDSSSLIGLNCASRLVLNKLSDGCLRPVEHTHVSISKPDKISHLMVHRGTADLLNFIWLFFFIRTKSGKSILSDKNELALPISSPGEGLPSSFSHLPPIERRAWVAAWSTLRGVSIKVNRLKNVLGPSGVWISLSNKVLHEITWTTYDFISETYKDVFVDIVNLSWQPQTMASAIGDGGGGGVSEGGGMLLVDSTVRIPK